MGARNVFAFLLLVCLGASVQLQRSSVVYTPFERDEIVKDNYFGREVSDPYRALEDIDSEFTQNFVRIQQDTTEAFLAEVPFRESLRDHLTTLWNYPKVGSPDKVNGKYYYFANTGLQNQSVMYVKDKLEDEGRVFLDPNTFSEDGTIALGSYSFTDDGATMSYTVSQSGSDWVLVRFRDVATNQDLPDVLKDTKWPSASWSKDNKGVFYARYPPVESITKTTGSQKSETTENSKIYYHVLGTSQADDILIAEFPEAPKRLVSCTVTEDGKYAVITGQEAFGANTVHIIPLSDVVDSTLQDKIIPLFPDPKDASYLYITNIGSKFYFKTTKDAPNYRIITVEVNSGVTRGNVKSTVFLEENPKNVLSWATVVATDKMIVCYLEDVKNTLEMRNLEDGSFVQKFDLPAGSIGGFSNENKDDTEFFFSLTNFLSPGTTFRCVVEKEANCNVYNQIKVGNIDLDQFVVEQVFYESKDGTNVPMYILRKKSTPLDGTAPTLLYGYGGFNVVLLPSFSVSNLVFVDKFNGIYALANIRGGGEYGEAWHTGGSRFNKQNVFDDFQAGAEYLIKNKYTSAPKLTIQGGSNGGLLVGACVNQRPDLFGAAIAQVGVMDMLRFQKFTIGYAWCPEYGCSDNQTDFENLIKYSPLHNIRIPTEEKVQYPSVLVTTADHDDRVVPAHSYKYIAELQHVVGSSNKQTNPLLLRVDIKAGHGAGKPTSKRIAEVVDIFSFIGRVNGVNFSETKISV